jgi:hypothetical protein
VRYTDPTGHCWVPGSLLWDLCRAFVENFFASFTNIVDGLSAAADFAAGNIVKVRGSDGQERRIQSIVKQGPSGVAKAAYDLTDGESKAANNLVRQYLNGANPGSGTRHIAGDIFEMRNDSVNNVVRVYFRVKDGVIQILGYSTKDNQDRIIKMLVDYYG